MVKHFYNAKDIQRLLDLNSLRTAQFRIQKLNEELKGGIRKVSGRVAKRKDKHCGTCLLLLKPKQATEAKVRDTIMLLCTSCLEAAQTSHEAFQERMEYVRPKVEYLLFGEGRRLIEELLKKQQEETQKSIIESCPTARGHALFLEESEEFRKVLGQQLEGLIQDIQSIRRYESEVRHLKNAMEILQFICLQEARNNALTSNHYEVLYKLIFERKSAEEIAKESGIGKRTVNKLVSAASERLIMLYDLFRTDYMEEMYSEIRTGYLEKV